MGIILIVSLLLVGLFLFEENMKVLKIFLNIALTAPLKLILIVPVILITLIIYLAGYTDTGDKILNKLFSFKLFNNSSKRKISG